MEQPNATARYRPFHCKGLATLVTTLSFLTMTLSGVALYVSPRGRITHWTAWDLLGITRDQWAGLHITLATLFVVAGLIHLYFNWTVFLHYLMTGWKPNLVREMAVAMALTLAVILMSLYQVPPVSTLADWREDIKDLWEQSPQHDPESVGTAQGMGSMTLNDWCASTGIPIDQALTWFAEQGVTAQPDQRMRELSAQTGMAPGAIRRGLKQHTQ